jgi:hypothetical protein
MGCDEVSPADDEPRDKRSTPFSLALAALVSWPATLRMLTVILAVIIVLAVITLLAVWLLPIDVSVGPVQVTGRTG